MWQFRCGGKTQILQPNSKSRPQRKKNRGGRQALSRGGAAAARTVVLSPKIPRRAPRRGKAPGSRAKIWNRSACECRAGFLQCGARIDPESIPPPLLNPPESREGMDGSIDGTLRRGGRGRGDTVWPVGRRAAETKQMRSERLVFFWGLGPTATDARRTCEVEWGLLAYGMDVLQFFTPVSGFRLEFLVHKNLHVWLNSLVKILSCYFGMMNRTCMCIQHAWASACHHRTSRTTCFPTPPKRRATVRVQPDIRRIFSRDSGGDFIFPVGMDKTECN